MPLAPEVLAAYQNADYVVFGDTELVLRIGEPSPRLDALLDSHEAATAAYVTAANPRGEKKSAADNAGASAVLDDLIAKSGYPRYPGEGRDPDGRWGSEPSVL